MAEIREGLSASLHVASSVLDATDRYRSTSDERQPKPCLGQSTLDNTSSVRLR